MAIEIYSPVGADPEETHTDARFRLGQCAEGSDNSEWVYVQADAGGITDAGYVVLFDENYAADMVDTTNSATAFGQKVGVAAIAFAASEYGWVQVKGKASIRVGANAAANAALNTTATAGELDDDGTVGAEVVDGVILTTANGGSAANAEGLLNWPTIGATL